MHNQNLEANMVRPFCREHRVDVYYENDVGRDIL